jgi:CheY-like chemotaxis protein
VLTPADLMLSDIGLPAMDGYELITRVRALPSEQGSK